MFETEWNDIGVFMNYVSGKEIGMHLGKVFVFWNKVIRGLWNVTPPSGTTRTFIMIFF